MFSVGVDLHGKSCVCLYKYCAWVCLFGNSSASLLFEWGIREQEQPLLSQATRFRNSQQPLLSPQICPLPCGCQRHEDLLGTALPLPTSILQGLPLHPLCIKAVNQKRSFSEENKSENYVYLNTSISTACWTGLAFVCILLTIHAC